MKVSSTAKIVLAYLAVQLSSAAVVLGYVTKQVESSLERGASQSNFVITAGLQAFSKREGPGVVLAAARSLQEAGTRVGKRIQIVERAPAHETSMLEPRADGEPSWSAITSTGRLRNDSQVIVTDEMRASADLRRVIAIAFGGSMLLGLEAACLLAFLLHRATMKRIAQFARTAAAIGNGEFEGRVVLTGDGGPFDRLGMAMNAMIAKLARLVHEIRTITDAVAHDVRSPAMRLHIHGERALEASELEHAREAVGLMLHEADAIVRITSTALQISRAEASLDREAFVAVDLSDLVERICESYRAAAENMRISAASSPRIQVYGSAQLLAQLVSNLIDNALRHAADGGVCDVDLRVEDRLVRLTVRDRGPGIAASDRESALRRFVKLDPGRSREGAGLGLPLAAAVAKLHDGSLTLGDAQPGLEVKLLLPRAGHAAAAVYPARSET